MKNIVIISSSLRGQSSSRILANQALKGAKENNNAILIDLQDIKPEFCIGCLACQRTGKCVIQDKMKDVVNLVKNADTIVFATPIYYYSISGQLKTFMDRLNPLYTARDRKFKEVYTIFTCADEDISAIEKPQTAIQGWVDCFYGVKYVNSFNGTGISSIDDLTDEIKDKAYQFGKNL